MFPGHLLALPLRRIARAQGRADGSQRNAAFGRQGANLAERNVQVLMNIVAQRLQRRNVDDFGLIGERTQSRPPDQSVDAQQKRGQGFSRARGRGDEDVVSFPDFRPSAHLRFRSGAEAAQLSSNANRNSVSAGLFQLKEHVLVGFIPIGAYAIGRLGPSFAAIALDLPSEMSRSWQATMGHGGRLLALYLLAGLGWVAIPALLGALAGLLGLGEIAPYALLFISAFVSTALLAVLVTINALVFRLLTGGPA